MPYTSKKKRKEYMANYNKTYYKKFTQKYTVRELRLALQRIEERKEAKKHLETIFVGGYENSNEFCCVNEGTIL